MPLLAYHYPAMSSPGIRVEHLTDLPVAGCNDSSDDPARLLQELFQFDGDIYVGDTTFLLLAGMVGAAGAILAIANVEPERCIAAFGGDPDTQCGLIGPTSNCEGPISRRHHRTRGKPLRHLAHYQDRLIASGEPIH
jgi:4-hydroxy-tetrahydrodipicolinate synthase